MKKKILVAMTSSLVASSVFAQGSNEPTNMNIGTSSATASQTVNSRNALPASSGGESTASIADNTPKGIKRFSFLYMNETEAASAAGVNQGVNPPWSGLNRVQFGYDISATKKLIIREDSTFKMPLGQTIEYHMTDPFVGYTDTDFAHLPGGWVMTIQPRLYLPFGEDARFRTNAAGGEGGALIVDKSVGRLDIELAGLGEYINNTQDYYYALNSSTLRYDVKGALDWWTLLDLDLVYNITDKFVLQHDTYLFTKSYRAIPMANPTGMTILINETGFGYQIMKQVRLAATIENDAVFDTVNSVSMYRAQDILYNFYLKLSL